MTVVAAVAVVAGEAAASVSFEPVTSTRGGPGASHATSRAGSTSSMHSPTMHSPPRGAEPPRPPPAAMSALSALSVAQREALLAKTLRAATPRASVDRHPTPRLP